MAENGLGITICAMGPEDDKPVQFLAHDSLTRPPQTYETAAGHQADNHLVCPTKFEDADALDDFTLEDHPRAG
jgi:hypothetical protein